MEDFGDTTQLAIVKHLFDLCETDPNNKGKYLKVLFEFMGSKFSSVLFELSNNLVNYTNNWNVLTNSVSQLLKILQETPDSNVKLIIIEKLFFFKKVGLKLIKKNTPELLKILEKENYDVKRRILDIILDVVEPHDVSKLLSILQKQIEDLYHEQKLSPPQLKMHH